MDGRNKNGGKRPNSGRKSKEDLNQMISNMDATKAPIKVWNMLADKVDEGDVSAIKTWLQYRYGMPKQVSEVEVKNVEISFED